MQLNLAQPVGYWLNISWHRQYSVLARVAVSIELPAWLNHPLEYYHEGILTMIVVAYYYYTKYRACKL